MLTLRLSFASIRNRWVTATLTSLSIALSVTLYLLIQQIRMSAREGFSNTISQTDLIVGAKGSPLQLLLYSVFHLGSPTENISYKTYDELKQHPAILSTIPISLGDSHRSFRVVGTDENFFLHYRYRKEKSLSFEVGRGFQDLFDIVIGSEVASKLRYRVGDPVILSHGISEGASIYDHGNLPFRIVGILQPTHTAVDRGLYISLAGMEAIHADWSDGVPPSADEASTPEQIRKKNLYPKQITSFLVRAKSRIDVLRLQREVSRFNREPLIAAIPGVVLSELWRIVSYIEDTLSAVSLIVLVVGFLGMLVSILTSLNERRREMAILRSLGATKSKIFSLFMIESAALSLAGVLLGLIFVYLGVGLSRPWLESAFGVYLEPRMPASNDFIFLIAVVVAGLLLGLIPAFRAYRSALSDALKTRL